MWMPMHGCALPLPKRSIQRCGVRQFGPKPSPLFTRCSTNVQLAWILRIAGAEGVIEFCLARAEMTRCRYEKEAWLKHVRCAEKLQYQLIKREAEEAALQPKPLSWEERRQALIQREQQRRYGDAHRGLERSWDKPSTPRPRRLSAAERMERAHRKHRYLVTGT